jgi:hypothetical protein
VGRVGRVDSVDSVDSVGRGLVREEGLQYRRFRIDDGTSHLWGFKNAR